MSQTDKSYTLFNEKDTETQLQILNDAIFISHCTNTLGKGINPIILLPAMGK